LNGHLTSTIRRYLINIREKKKFMSILERTQMYFPEETLREFRVISKYWRDDPFWIMNGAGASQEGDLFVHHDKYLHVDDGKYHEELCRFVNYLSVFSQIRFVFF
jgi:hypothetical protein